MASVCKEISRECRTRNLPAPSRGTVLRRIARLDPVKATSARQGQDAARPLKSAGGIPPEATGLLQQVQADHIAPCALTATSAATVRSVWAAAGAPPRAGITVWRPYEILAQPARQTLMHAAGLALQLAEAGEIRPRGTLGRYLRREPHREVYEGDRRAWEWKQAVAEFTAEFNAAAGLARSGDADAARKLLTWYTLGCRTSESFSGARRFLTGLGIPGHLLPTHEDRDFRPLRACGRR